MSEEAKPYTSWDELVERTHEKRSKWYGFIYNRGVFGYNLWYWSHHPVKLVTTILWRGPKRTTVRFVQRGCRGYADEDLWSLDHYLAGWLPAALRSYKRGHSFPGGEDCPTFEDWCVILEKMAYGFEAHTALLVFDWKDEEERVNLIAAQDEGLALFVKWFGALWD